MLVWPPAIITDMLSDAIPILHMESRRKCKLNATAEQEPTKIAMSDFQICETPNLFPLEQIMELICTLASTYQEDGEHRDFLARKEQGLGSKVESQH